jgi:hypothetical protein
MDLTKEARNRETKINSEREKNENIKSERESIRIMALEMRDLINDDKYKSFKYLLELHKKTSELKRNNIINSVKTSDEYVIFGVSLDAEIGLIDKILNMPEFYIKQLEEIKNGGM